MSERRYIVRGKVAKSAPGLNIKAGMIVWLGFTREAGGWYDWSKQQQCAFPFETKDAAKEASASIGPWYYVPAPESIEILEADYTPPQSARIELIQ